jgi:hypothetical protein
MSNPVIGSLIRAAVIIPVACASLGFATPVNAAGAFDGVYKGTQQTTKTNNDGACANLDHAATTLTITDNHFTRKWSAVLEVTVAPDGSFQQSVVAGMRPLRTATITGKIVSGNLEADIGTDLCSAHLSLKKS